MNILKKGVGFGIVSYINRDQSFKSLHIKQMTSKRTLEFHRKLFTIYDKIETNRVINTSSSKKSKKFYRMDLRS